MTAVDFGGKFKLLFELEVGNVFFCRKSDKICNQWNWKFLYHPSPKFVMILKMAGKFKSWGNVFFFAWKVMIFFSSGMKSSGTDADPKYLKGPRSLRSLGLEYQMYQIDIIRIKYKEIRSYVEGPYLEMHLYLLVQV